MQQMTRRITMETDRDVLFGNASLAPMRNGLDLMNAITSETAQFVTQRVDRQLGLQRSLAHCEDWGSAYGRLAGFWQQAAEDYLGYFQTVGTMPFKAVKAEAAEDVNGADYGGQTGD